MKKILILFIAVSLVACGSNKKATDNNEESAIPLATKYASEINAQDLK